MSSIAFLYDRMCVVSGSWDRSCMIWNVSTRKVEHTLKDHLHQVKCVAFSCDGTHVVSGEQELVQV